MAIETIFFRAKSSARLNKFAFVWAIFLAALSTLELSREACAIGVAALTLIPLLLSWIQQRRLLVADPIIVLGLMWMLAVTMPVMLPQFYKSRMWFELSPWSLDEASRWMFRGWASACVAYWAGRVFTKKLQIRAPTAFDMHIQVMMRRLIGLIGVTGSVFFIFATGGKTYQILEAAAVVDSTMLQIIHLLKNMSYAYVFLYFFDKGQKKRLFKVDKYIMIAVLGAQAILFIGSGSKYAIMVLGASWILGSATSTLRLGFLKESRIAILGVIVVFAVSYVIAAYRGELVTRALPPPNASVTDVVSFQFDVMGDAIWTLVEGGEIGRGYYTNYDNSFILDRFAHLSAFAVFMEFINFSSPYENAAESVIAPVFAVIPSALVPNKVRFFNSGDFAKLYGWSYGGLSISTPGSFFWAWGYSGIIIGMASLGLGIAWLWSRSFGLSSSSLIWRVVMVTTVLALMDVGVTFQFVIIPATRVLLLLFILRWGLQILLSTSKKRGIRW